jgi:hypothetical protein
MSASLDRPRLSVSISGEHDRKEIYRLRHVVFAAELSQYPQNSEGRLVDDLDTHNVYVHARQEGTMVGFISITPPSAGRYSIDKHVAREDLPFPMDEGVYEMRLLAVPPRFRGRELPYLLTHAALRWVEAQRGTRVVALGRHEALPLYRKMGLDSVDIWVDSGAVRYQVITATTEQIRARTARINLFLSRIEDRLDWQLPFPYFG